MLGEQGALLGQGLRPILICHDVDYGVWSAGSAVILAIFIGNVLGSVGLPVILVLFLHGFEITIPNYLVLRDETIVYSLLGACRFLAFGAGEVPEICGVCFGVGRLLAFEKFGVFLLINLILLNMLIIQRDPYIHNILSSCLIQFW